ncbi:hypothetical protein LXL04_017015 [Taraxacum kok-saghyz]
MILRYSSSFITHLLALPPASNSTSTSIVSSSLVRRSPQVHLVELLICAEGVDCCSSSKSPTQAELREVLIRSFLFSNTITAPQSRVFDSQPIGNLGFFDFLEFLIAPQSIFHCLFDYRNTLDIFQVISIMSMWTRMQPAYAANMWNEALNMRLGTEVIDKIRIQNNGYI